MARACEWNSRGMRRIHWSFANSVLSAPYPWCSHGGTPTDFYPLFLLYALQKGKSFIFQVISFHDTISHYYSFHLLRKSVVVQGNGRHALEAMTTSSEWKFWFRGTSSSCAVAWNRCVEGCYGGFCNGKLISAPIWKDDRRQRVGRADGNFWTSG